MGRLAETKFPQTVPRCLVLGSVSWDKLSVRTRLVKSRHTVGAMVHVSKEIDVTLEKKALPYFSDVGPFSFWQPPTNDMAMGAEKFKVSPLASVSPLLSLPPRTSGQPAKTLLRKATSTVRDRAEGFVGAIRLRP